MISFQLKILLWQCCMWHEAMLEELKKHYNKLSFTSAMGNQDYDDSDDEAEAITNGTNSLSLAVPNGERRRSSIKMKEITINN